MPWLGDPKMSASFEAIKKDFRYSFFSLNDNSKKKTYCPMIFLRTSFSESGACFGNIKIYLENITEQYHDTYSWRLHTLEQEEQIAALQTFKHLIMMKKWNLQNYLATPWQCFYICKTIFIVQNEKLWNNYFVIIIKN